MMLILLLVFWLYYPLHAQFLGMNFQDDKMAHMYFSAWLTNQCEKYGLNWWQSGLVVLSVGIAKEISDIKYTGFDTNDIAWNMIGWGFNYTVELAPKSLEKDGVVTNVVAGLSRMELNLNKPDQYKFNSFKEWDLSKPIYRKKSSIFNIKNNVSQKLLTSESVGFFEIEKTTLRDISNQSGLISKLNYENNVLFNLTLLQSPSETEPVEAPDIEFSFFTETTDLICANKL